MFVGMEALLTWHEKLEKLATGKTLEVDNRNSVYSAIRMHFPKTLTQKKRFSIRTNPVDQKEYVIRIK